MVDGGRFILRAGHKKVTLGEFTVSYREIPIVELNTLKINLASSQSVVIPFSAD